MPPKKFQSTSKRKATTAPDPPNKRSRPDVDTSESPSSPQQDEDGIVQRKFYPPEMTNERCHQYNNNEIPRPIEVLESAMSETAQEREGVTVKDSVVHWFKCDLRIQDNTALHMAAEKAKEKDVPLICLYLVSPQDFEAHLTSPARVDFILRSLEVLKEDLGMLDIPLYVEVVEKRKTIPDRLVALCEQWSAAHVYANIEYEVDELRREALLVRKCLEKGIAFSAVADTCVVAPGKLHTQAGKQFAVYSLWFRAWLSFLHSNPIRLDLHKPPDKNSTSTRTTHKHLFESRIPPAPENKKLSAEEQKRFRSLWPAGEHEAHARLKRFLHEKVRGYKDMRDFPGANSTAVVSVHLASGTLSARTAVSMNKPFKPAYTNITWNHSPHHLHAWKTGQTGSPIVDASMRQLLHTGYMHNRCRMIVASFLTKDLLLDWRLGEKFFMQHLIDGDFASNNGGWGFCASVGVDPQPYFRVFNPVLQGERFDAEGEFIRRWVPELRRVEGKAVHDPYGRGKGSVVEREGYPRLVVEHKFGRERALERYKEGLAR
ncbi:MAG: hypothetical protein M1834_004656 [Cirrosporium novae-zelandiae]|nr:MAG: hypothetical protein M1834_004656 [Cirrosporium novae-zelandiae]